MDDDNHQSNMTSKKRKYDRSHALMIWRVRQFFEQELRSKKRYKLNQVVDRTAAATGVSRTIASKLKSENDVEKAFHEVGEHVAVQQKSQVPDNFRTIVRQTIRDLFLEKKQVPTLDTIFEKLLQIRVEDINHLNILDTADLCLDGSTVWKRSRSTLCRFMKKIGFVYDDRVTHYEYTKYREDIIKMRDDYLDWIQNYRTE